MVTIKSKYVGKKFAGGTYVKPTWDDIYLDGRAGEDVMQYDYARTISVNYNWMGLSVGHGEKSRVPFRSEGMVQ